MTLSFSNLNEIGNLYESIAASEQEQLNEGGGIGAGIAAQQARQQKAQAQGTRKALQQGKSIGLASNEAGQNVGSLKLNSAETKKSGRSTLNITPDKNTKSYMDKDAVYGNKRTVGGDTYYRAKLGGKDVFVSGKKSGTQQPTQQPTQQQRQPTQQQQRQPAARTTPAATPAKTLPSKPAVPTGTTAGGTTFQRRAATGAELRAAQAARAAGKGEEGAIKASVAASKPAATSTLAAATAAASKPPAFKPATAPQATSAAPSTSAAASGSLVPATNKIAAASKPVTVKSSYEYDVYDLVLEYLLDNGHVDGVEEANYVMMEMDAETIGNIVEARMDPRGRPASGPMNVYANPKKPSKEHSDAVKAYDAKQKKKTPEQKKKELDDYIQRQRENK
jgi:hypothetical protein